MSKRKISESAAATPQSTKKRKSDSTSSPHALSENSKDAQASRNTKVVEDANALPRKDFLERYVSGPNMQYHNREHEYDCTITFETARTSNKWFFNPCYNLIENTSRSNYESSSWGWHPKRKRKEMREPEMKYLLLKRTGSAEQSLDGFLSFMLTHDSTPSVPVLYVYEVHLQKDARGVGLGRHLMVLAEEIAKRVGVEKVMLTCFVSNNTAREFYVRQGYGPDECSPRERKTRNKTVKPDYVIMSKRTRSSNQTDSQSEVAEAEPVNEVASDEETGDDSSATEDSEIEEDRESDEESSDGG